MRIDDEVPEGITKLLSPEATFALTNLTPRTLKNKRTEDRARIAQGLEPKGPPFVRLGKRVGYPEDLLKAWIEKQKEESLYA